MIVVRQRKMTEPKEGMRGCGGKAAARVDRGNRRNWLHCNAGQHQLQKDVVDLPPNERSKKNPLHTVTSPMKEERVGMGPLADPGYDNPNVVLQCCFWPHTGKSTQARLFMFAARIRR